MIKSINIIEAFRLTLDLDAKTIHVTNYTQSIKAKIDVADAREVEEYILNNSNARGYAFVLGKVDDGVLNVQGKTDGWKGSWEDI